MYNNENNYLGVDGGVDVSILQVGVKTYLLLCSSSFFKMSVVDLLKLKYFFAAS